jgi:hypothetical protein
MVEREERDWGIEISQGSEWSRRNYPLRTTISNDRRRAAPRMRIGQSAAVVVATTDRITHDDDKGRRREGRKYDQREKKEEENIAFITMFTITDTTFILERC